MIFVCESELSSSDLALLGNNIRPRQRVGHRDPNDRTNRRVLAAVNRSLARLKERVDRLEPIGSKPSTAHALAS